jgi:hypothetical protein
MRCQPAEADAAAWCWTTALSRLRTTSWCWRPDDPDYARLWKLVNDNSGNRYDAYQKKTTRPIPVVALSRRAI